MGGSGRSSTPAGGGGWPPAFFLLARLETIRSWWLWPEPDPGEPSWKIILSVSMVAAATVMRGIELLSLHSPSSLSLSLLWLLTLQLALWPLESRNNVSFYKFSHDNSPLGSQYCSCVYQPTVSFTDNHKLVKSETSHWVNAGLLRVVVVVVVVEYLHCLSLDKIWRDWGVTCRTPDTGSTGGHGPPQPGKTGFFDSLLATVEMEILMLPTKVSVLKIESFIILSVLQSIEYDSTKSLKFFTLSLMPGTRVRRLGINDYDYTTFSPSSSHPIWDYSHYFRWTLQHRLICIFITCLSLIKWSGWSSSGWNSFCCWWCLITRLPNNISLKYCHQLDSPHSCLIISFQWIKLVHTIIIVQWIILNVKHWLVLQRRSN